MFYLTFFIFWIRLKIGLELSGFLHVPVRIIDSRVRCDLSDPSSTLVETEGSYPSTL